MTHPASSVAADARNRAVRTFLQGLAVDVVLAVAVALSAALADPGFAWSAGYWRLLGLSLAKTVLMTVAAYVMRLKVPPASG